MGNCRRWLCVSNSIIAGNIKPSLPEPSPSENLPTAHDSYGLSESKCKQVWTELVKADDKASTEAEMLYPVPNPNSQSYSQSVARDQLMKQAEYAFRLRSQYKKDVLQRYGFNGKTGVQDYCRRIGKKLGIPTFEIRSI